MAVLPIGNSGFNYFPSAAIPPAQGISAATTPDKPELHPQECKTCAARRYVDQSGDSSVSFQTPTKLSPGEAALAVASHEYEHVVHNREKARREGMVAHSTVSISYGVCPECGRIYVAGGKTETHFTPKQELPDLNLGNNINTFA